MNRSALWIVCCVGWPVLLGARGCDPDPVPIGVATCEPARCGAPLGLHAIRCADGSTGGSTGRCLASANGECAWEVRECPMSLCGDGGTCPTCPAGLVDCAGTCRDLGADPAACGACGQSCATGQVCNDGVCGDTCGGGLVNCGGACHDLATDALDCGACGQACPTGQVCSQGACVAGCPPQNELCMIGAHYDPTPGVCACVPDVDTCSPGLVVCAGSCHDLATDPLDCGACGQACATGEVCSSGACVAGCPPENELCAIGAHYDPTPGVCACVPDGSTCGAGLVVCGGTCHDLATDARDCGACGNVCPTGQVCIAGACGTPP